MWKEKYNRIKVEKQKLNIKFLGAAGTVTGSRHLLEWDKKVLVDCGLFQGLKELRMQNRAPFIVNPESIDAVIITHAHLDHIGYLPVLFKNGFQGKVYCTAPTKELAKILLLDAAHIEEEDADFANKKKYSKHNPALPLFTTQDVYQVLNNFHVLEMQTAVEIFPDTKLTFHNSGHIVGSALVQLEIEGRNVLFSGDLGRCKPLILEPKSPIIETNFLILESTYGDRLHEDKSIFDSFAKIILDTLAKRGQLLIPSFAVGRTQDLLYLLLKLKEQSKIPNIPIYLDSPLATEATEIFLRHPDWNHLSSEELRSLSNIATVIKSRQQSKDLLQTKNSSIVIAGSGMVTGGRILHHLAHRIHDPKNTVLLVGYQAPGTRGRLLQDGASEIKMHGEYFQVKAEIKELSGLSAHADQLETIEWLKGAKNAPQKTFIVHGEPQAADALRLKIEDVLGWSCVIPKQGESFSLV